MRQNNAPEFAGAQPARIQSSGVIPLNPALPLDIRDPKELP